MTTDHDNGRFLLQGGAYLASVDDTLGLFGVWHQNTVMYM